MRRDDLYITVPSFFRCPISLDVMKSPVSLCTGVTYDRSCIQRWLDSGNNTCPATMQVLQTKDLVPNHTLQRLIQIWSDSVKTKPEPNRSSSISHDQVRDLIKQFVTDFRVHSELAVNSDRLSKLLSFSEESIENRKFIASLSSESDFLAILTSFLVHNPKNLKVMEKILPLWKMLLERGGSVSKLGSKVNDIYPAIIYALKQGSSKLKIEMLKALELIISTYNSEFSKSLLPENSELYSVLISFSTINSEWNIESMESSISCLIFLAMVRRNRVKVVKSGAVKAIGKALSVAEIGTTLTAKLLKLLELISTCKEGRIELCKDGDCIQAIVKKVLKVSNEATEHAVTILWSLCCLFRDKKAQESVAKSNGMAKILLLLQSNCSPAVRQMAADLLKVFRVNSKAAASCLSTSYDTKTTHIMPF